MKRQPQRLEFCIEQNHASKSGGYKLHVLNAHLGKRKLKYLKWLIDEEFITDVPNRTDFKYRDKDPDPIFEITGVLRTWTSTKYFCKYYTIKSPAIFY